MAVKPIILDSCVWVALFNRADTQHKKALAILDKLKGPVVIPEYVLIEVLNTLGRKARKCVADDFIQLLASSDDFLLQSVEAAELEILMHFYLGSEEDGLSFVDHHLWMLAKNHKVITFDQKLSRHLD